MISIQGLKKTFNGKIILDGLDLVVKPKIVTTVIGQSGCGKSVLLKHMVGIHRGDEGTVNVDGIDVGTADKEELSYLRTKFSYLFQGGALFDSLSVWENVAFPLMWGGGRVKMHSSEARKKSREMLELVGMKDVEDLRPSELSGGMKKRVALARAVIKNPEYILYDEPTTGLDPVMSSVIDNMIIKLSRELDVTSVVVTHDMTSVEKISDVVCMLYGGRIIFNGKFGMLKKSDNGIVRQFVNRESTGPIGFGR